MMGGTLKRTIVAVLALALAVAGCSPLANRQRTAGCTPTTPLSDSETIAGEILAYLMEVVLGQAGPTGGREAWATRGAQLPLSFELAQKRMVGPVNQRAELMVLDTNILGLSQVLYHYDPRLNLFKGRRGHDSLYPCTELMALRLLLLAKIRNGEKVNLAAIIRHRDRFSDIGGQIDAQALAAMNLGETEFQLLKAVFQSEPAFWCYIQHPFIASTLKRLGIAAQDTLTLMADQAANYRSWTCPTAERQTVTVAILPSMTALFDVPEDGAGPVSPAPKYRRLMAHLQSAIRDKLASRLASRTSSPSSERLRFWSPDRPMVVHPQNAGRVIENVCPQADFVVVLLGKNVYRALSIDPGRDIFPHERRIYLDVDDVLYQSMDDTIETIADALLPHLVD